MRNLYLKRRDLPKVGNLVDWANVVSPFIRSAHKHTAKASVNHLVSHYGTGPFRVKDIRFQAFDVTFYYLLEGVPLGDLIDEWFADELVVRYTWGVS